MCRPFSLDNIVRRWLASAERELRPLDLGLGQVVADIGAGVGYFEPEILRRIGPAGSIWATDIDAENLARGRSKVPSGASVRWLVAPANHLDEIPSSSVDRLLSYLVLCCLVDKRGAMREAWRLLRPGGLALVTYPRGLRADRRSRHRPLRVTRERWQAATSGQAWRERPIRSGRIIVRHLLEKPPVCA